MPKRPASLNHAPQPPESPASEPRPPRLPWTELDLAQLRLLCEQRLGDEEIAARLGRTQRAVRTMILRLGGERLREPSAPWTEAELEIVSRLHASGVICASIAEALPGRTPIAVFRKLCRLVGPAPSAEAKRAWRRTKRPEAPAKSLSLATTVPAAQQAVKAAEAPIRLYRPIPPQPPQHPIPATVDAMVRWLRSRDYVVLHRSEGWQIDHHHLQDDDSLVLFVNLRRARLHLPSFVMVAPQIMPTAIASEAIRVHAIRGRRAFRPQHAGR